MSKYKPWKWFETEIVQDLKKQGWIAKRLWDRQMKEKFGVDIIAEDFDKRLMIQCKYGKHPNLKEAYLQAMREAVKNDLVIGIGRWAKEHNTLAVIEWKKLLKLLKLYKKEAMC